MIDQWSVRCLWFNSLPKDKFFDRSKLKAFVDNKIDVNQSLKFVSGRAVNIVRKGENAGYQHFFLFLQFFLEAYFTASLTVRILW